VRVTFLTHYYPPEVGAPQVRIASIAHRLAERGAEVTVHTGFPHYPDGPIQPPYRNRPLVVEESGPVRVVRSAVYPAPNRGTWRRLADHAAFAASALASAPAAGRCDVLVVETPPLFTAAAAILYAWAKRAPLVVNVADRWPASAVELGALSNPALIRAATMLERAVYRAARAITVPTEGIADALSADRHANGKVVRMPPAVDVGRFAIRQASAAGPLRVLYAGTVGMAHGLQTLLDAAALAGPDVVQVTIAGGGAEAGELRTRLPDNVRMIGVVPHEQVPELYAESDAAVVLLRDLPVFRGALPTKLLEAMAAGRPVVLSAGGEAAALVEQAGAGVVVVPEDPGALAAGFKSLHADPGERARLGRAGTMAVERDFDRRDAVDRWFELLEAIAARR
jgi:colanic acid biosynthesis glycosyl transferase WcaI